MGCRGAGILPAMGTSHVGRQRDRGIERGKQRNCACRKTAQAGMQACQNGGAAGRLRKLPFGKKMPSFSFQNPPGKIAFAKPKAVRMGTASFAAGSWVRK